MLAGNRTRDGGRHTTRSSTDPFTDYLYDQPTDFDVVDAVVEVAGARGVPPAQVALAWLLAKPGVTAPIVGVDQEEAPEGRAGGRGADVVRGRDGRTGEALRAAPGARALLGSAARRSARVAAPSATKAAEIGGGMRVALTVADFLNRAALVYGHRAAVVDEPDGAGLARDADLRRARGPGPGHGPGARRPRGRARRAGGHRQPELGPVPDRRTSASAATGASWCPSTSG